MSRPVSTDKQLIAEIGINHDGDPKIASALLHELADSGVRSVKFQYRNIKRAYSSVRGAPRELGDEIVGEELLRTHLGADQQLMLLSLAHNLGLDVGISFFSAEDVGDFGNRINEFDFFKVPSAELQNTDLLDCLLAMDRLVLISTGGHSEDQIVQALERIERLESWFPLHAVMNYPTAHHNSQLGYIQHLSERWRRPVGSSSHDVDWEVCLLAAAFGADYIERHVTHSKKAQGLDHSSSSEVAEASQLARMLQSFSTLQRRPEVRLPNQGELINLQNLGRSYYARKDLDTGNVVKSDDFEYRSPRRGFGASEAQQSWGRALALPVRKGEALANIYFGESSRATNEEVIWADDNRVGIPVRPTDWKPLTQVLPVQTLEFHLSYMDVASGLSSASLPKDCNYSVHLPDYTSPTSLLDPYSPADVVREQSKQLMDACLVFAQELQEFTQQPVPVIGSFSRGQRGSVETYFDGQREIVEAWRSKSVLLVHQWLPPYAWYFGGSEPIERFNSLEDLELCLAYDLPLCLDTAHAALCVNAGTISVAEFQSIASPVIGHCHIAGSSGVDAEGVPLRGADQSCKELIDWCMSLPTSKILERWQGHLLHGQGFVEDLQTLREWEVIK